MSTINIVSIVAQVIVQVLADFYSGKCRGITLTPFWVVGAALHDLGIDPRGELPDQVLRGDHEGNYPTWVGEQLIRAERSYDWETHWSDRTAGCSAGPEEEVISYGDPHYEYKAICPVDPRISDELAETVHLEAWKQAPALMLSASASAMAKKKAWGSAQNLALVAAGCSQAEVQAWWSLQWKREWSPAQWAALCREATPQQVAWGLAAHSSRYLEAVGLFVSSSFPRSLDAVQALARAKGITKGVKKPFWDTPVDEVAPSAIVNGAKVWSF